MQCGIIQVDGMNFLGASKCDRIFVAGVLVLGWSRHATCILQSPKQCVVIRVDEVKCDDKIQYDATCSDIVGCAIMPNNAT